MTHKQRQAMSQMSNYKAFLESVDNIRASVLISMGHLVHKKIKTRAENLMTAFDLYDKEVYGLTNVEGRKHLLEDYDESRAICDKFMNIEQALKDHQNEQV